MKDYYVYILRCTDGSYYTGVTSNLEKRIEEHNSGLFGGYTATRLPVELVYLNKFNDINEAIRSEKQIKGWSRAKKEALIRGNHELSKELSKSKNKKFHSSTSSP